LIEFNSKLTLKKHSEEKEKERLSQPLLLFFWLTVLPGEL
jgi:hypothetical protein